MNYISENSEIPYKFPTKENYEMKGKQIIKNGEYWCTFVQVPRKKGYNIGLGIGSEGRNQFEISMGKSFLSPGGSFEPVRIGNDFQGTVYAYQRNTVVYGLTVKYFEKQPIKFSYQHTGQTEVHDIGTFGNDFNVNVTLTRRGVFYPTMRFYMKTEKPTFIQFAWKLLSWN